MHSRPPTELYYPIIHQSPENYLDSSHRIPIPIPILSHHPILPSHHSHLSTHLPAYVAKETEITLVLIGQLAASMSLILLLIALTYWTEAWTCDRKGYVCVPHLPSATSFTSFSAYPGMWNLTCNLVYRAWNDTRMFLADCSS
jgi:hypothetical protein